MGKLKAGAQHTTHDVLQPATRSHVFQSTRRQQNASPIGVWGGFWWAPFYCVALQPQHRVVLLRSGSSCVFTTRGALAGWIASRKHRLCWKCSPVGSGSCVPGLVAPRLAFRLGVALLTILPNYSYARAVF